VTIALDAPETYGAVDASDALGVVEASADQWAEAVARARAIDLPSFDGLTSVVFCGMGGSGIAGDVLAAVGAERGRVPVTVSKGYALPSFAGPDTLVIAASYSGNTEETLACADQALARGAHVVAITGGGRLAEVADEHGLLRIAPQAGIQPRAALASLTAPTLVLCERLGLLGDLGEDLAETDEVLRARTKALGRDVPSAQNAAKQLARSLDGLLPVVWGQDGLLAAAAIRWRCQLNENAKIPAFSSVLPELDHNELVGYDPGIESLGQIALVVLRVPGEHRRLAIRIEATLDEVSSEVRSVHEAWGTGETSLAKFMSVAVTGDFTSIYLALLRGVDPTPVQVIERLKRKLAG